MEKFSIVMPFRDTPRERKFAEKSIPSAISLNPDEFVIGVDEPVDESLLELIARLCSKESFTNYRVLSVPKSNKWKFQLANIIWHCYQNCNNDRILAFDVDSVLRPAVLRGLELVGRDDTAVVSFTKKLLIESAGDLVRYVSYRQRIRTYSYVFSGIYWIYKPYYFKDIDIEGMHSIENGIDTYMINRVSSINRHKILTLKEIGVNCLDRQNVDYPWRQFHDGIWYYVNRDAWNLSKKQELKYKKPLLKFMSTLLYKFPTLRILIKSAAYCHPWLLRGWIWAGQNPDHETCHAAYGLTFAQWGMMGSKYVKGIHDWNKHGRTGTGFE